MEEKKRSPWVYVAFGCAGLLLVGIILVVIAGVMGMRLARKYEAEMKDPLLRTQKALEIMGVERLPDGYYADFALQIPYLMDLVVLSDRPPDEAGTSRPPDQRGFLYVNALRVGPQEQKLRDFFEGRLDDPETLQESQIDIKVREPLGRGTLDLASGELHYVSFRGSAGVEERKRDGITALMLIDCEGEERDPVGIWFGPDRESEPTASVPEGNPANEADLSRFAEQFGFCPGGP